MSIRQKLFVLIAVPLVVAVSFLATAAWLGGLESTAAMNARRSNDTLISYNVLLACLNGAQNEMRGYVVTGSPDFRKSYRRATVAVGPAISRFAANAAEIGSERRRASGLISLALTSLSLDAGAVASMDRGHRNIAISAVRERTGDGVMEQFRLQGARFELGLNANRVSGQDQLLFLSHCSNVLLVVGLVVALATTSFLYFAISRNIFRRLLDLGSDALLVSRDIAPASAPHGNDEITQVVRTFHAMFDTMRDRHESLARYKLLWERAPDIMLWLDAEHRIIEANAAAAKAFDVAPSDLLGIDATTLCALESVPALSEALDRVREDGSVAETSTELLRNETTFPADVTISSIDLRGMPAILVVLRDVTERRRAEEAIAIAYDKAVESSRLKSQFVATMSHEIRTPMNAVIGMNELLLDTPLSEEQREYTQTVGESSLALLGIIDDILDFSKIDAGGLELEVADLNVTDIVESAASLLAESAQRKGISVMTYIDPQVPTIVLGDAVRLRQILVNLIGNAVKFTLKGGVVVSVTCRTQDRSFSQLRFTVKDSGIGFDADTAEKIFEPFRQADGSTTRKFGGTGLGLTISRRLVELMGGTMTVESTPSFGSEFAFTADFARSKHELGARVPAVKGLRGIIVDDDRSAQEILYRYLIDWGISATVASSAREALAGMREQQAAKTPYDIAIIDYAMPDLTGLDLAREIRADAGLQDIKLVMVTAFDGAKRGEAAIAAGFSSYLPKPVRKAQLLECIEKAVNAQDDDFTERLERRSTGRTEQNGDIPARSENILLVEDVVVNQKLVVQQLRKLGFAAHAVADGRQALNALSRQRYSLVLMDCQMPVMDGFEATRAIRKMELHTGRRIPIIAMTANARREDRDECLAAGMDDYLAKPVTIAHIREKLAVWLPDALVVA